jgi:GNAT superfamily N-acetyltransferase
MDIMVRQASLADARGIARVLRDLGWFEHLAQESEDATTQRVTERLQTAQSNQSHTIYVAEGMDGQVMGYCAVHWLPILLLKGLEGYISELFIREDDRGKGIGTLLLESVQHEALTRGCSRLMLLNMRKRESYHREFYLKKGWHERDGAANFVFTLSED